MAIYPGKVEHTTKDKVLNQTCCNGRGYGTQKLYNKDNIKNGKATYASWGQTDAKATICASDYCKAIATPSGTRRQPEKIYATNWDTSSLPSGAKINSIKVELSYFTDGYSNFSNATGYFPDDTTIYLVNDKEKNIAGSQTIKGPNSKNTYRHVTFSGLNLSLSDFKKCKVGILIGENKRNSVVCRVKIQYLRVEVKYTDPTPKLTVTSSINKDKVKKNVNYHYTATIKSTNGQTDTTTFYVTVPNDTIISNSSPTLSKKSSNTTTTTYSCAIKKFNNNKATVSFDAKNTSPGKKTFNASLSKYSNSKPSSSINIVQPTVNYNLQAQYSTDGITWTNVDTTHFGCISKDEDKDGRHFECFTDGDCSGYKFRFVSTLSRDMYLTGNEYVTITAGKYPLTWQDNSNASKNNFKENDWQFTNFPNGTTTYISNAFSLTEPGKYTVKAKHTDTEVPSSNKEIEYIIKVKNRPLKKEYFKLKLEDGSDVQYNSLILTQGDDLKTPLEYEYIDDTEVKAEDFIITGETTRIPTNEAHYLTFKIKLNKTEPTKLQNVLAYIEAYSISEDEEDVIIPSDEIIIGIDNNGTLKEVDNGKYCLIKNISSEEETTLKLVVFSDYERTCYVKIRPYNYDLYGTKWKTGKVIFKDYPNVKIGIEGKHDVNLNEEFELKYYVENKSDIDGEKLNFHITEPYGFEPVKIDNKDYIFIESIGTNSPSYNNKKNNIYFPILEAHSRQYILTKKYKAVRKGNYNFSIETVDNINTTDDDQYKNIYKHNVLVGAENDIRVRTHVNKNKPYRNELIDFEITFINYYKDHKKPLYFDIKDIGAYSELHDNHYEFVYADCEYGFFKPGTDTIGRWTIDNIKANTEYKLTISIKPLETGLHHIKTILSDNDYNKEFINQVKVLEEKAKIGFNVYHAAGNENNDCENIDELIRICDTDYINLTDDIYYVIEINNNSKKDINNALHIYGRLPESFLKNGILCSSSNYTPIVNKENNLISYTINQLPHCSTIKIAFKVKPSDKGKFISNFMLSTRSADVLHKKLNLIVDDEFAKRELEHEIKIYNFDKTNRYYRYEIDNEGDIFKFFNTGDKSLRQIESESYDVDSVETYKGSNLKEIVNDIKKNSKYVDPVFIREGSNKLQDKGYELYPDGLIRRFGLLKSEVFHYANQIPEINNLVKKAMRWDIDEWDTKLWAGGNYVNGVFDLSIDYDKVPSNFTILDVDEPIKNLQALVDNVKPYGTKALCYYSTTVDIDFGINVDTIYTQAESTYHIDLDFNNIYLLSTFNRHDGNTYTVNDDVKLDIDLNIDKIVAEYPYHRNYYRNHPEQQDPEYNGKYPYHKDYQEKSKDIDDYKKYPYLAGRVEPNNNDDVSIGDYEIEPISTTVYKKDNNVDKSYIKNCLDIVENLYYTDDIIGIDITKPLMTAPPSTPLNYLRDMQLISCVNNCANNQTIGYSITYGNNQIIMGYQRQDGADFEGFIIEENDKTIYKRKNNEEAANFDIQIQTINIGTNDKIIHLWGSINQKEYHHIGFVRLSNLPKGEDDEIITPKLSFYSSEEDNNCDAKFGLIAYTDDKEVDEKITFKVSDKLNEQAIKHTHIEESGKRWKGLNKINKGGYAEIYYDAKNECDDNLKINIPKLILKYNDINIEDNDEITDIKFKIKAKSNNDDIINNININMCRDGDSILPENNISRKIYYPSKIENEKQELLTNIIIEEPNITICADCLKTSLGYYDTCPHCHSNNISHHNKVTPVTICDNCGWIIKGTHKYCKHCLSLDVTNVEVDYNKTYCNNEECHTLSDGYYHRCPKCFSHDVIYLDNKVTSYKIYDKETQNIKPINIQTNQKETNIFNATIPLNMYSSILNEVDYLNLNIEGTNQADTQYYYCDECGVGGLGNFDKCPSCNSGNVHNYEVDTSIFEVYMDINNHMSTSTTLLNFINDNTMPNGHFIKSLDLKQCIAANSNDSFSLSFYINNQKYEENIKQILNLPIGDKYISKILDKINKFNFTIDNIYTDYQFIDENNWVGINNLETPYHSYVKYEMPNGDYTSETLIFSDFSIPHNTYNKANLCISGLCKNNNNKFSATIEVFDIYGNKYKEEVNEINNDLFNLDIDLIKLIGNNLNNLTAKIYFNEVENAEEILISKCYIQTEHIEYEKDINTNLTLIPTTITKDNNKYLIKSDNDLWGINQQQPYYLSGEHLSTGLLCYIDFGQLKNGEYLRVYNIEAILTYKKKTGKITTNTIIIMNNNDAEAINNYEQYIDGTITKKNSDLWGFIDTTQPTLSNLEYEKLIINNDGELLNSIPLRNKILQSFIFNSGNIEDISKLYINYAGQAGYPSEYIDISLYDDKNDTPNKLIYKTKIQMPVTNQTLNIDFDIDNIKQRHKYWLVLEDNNADEYNYYKFKFNNNKNNINDDNVITASYDNLIYNNKEDSSKTLSFGFDSPLHEYNYYNLPFICEIDKGDIEEYHYEGEGTTGYVTINDNTTKFTEEMDITETYDDVINSEDIEKEYKIQNVLYRYNVQDDNNIYLTDLIIKNGYKIIL